ncbi:peptidase M50 [Sphingomonas sp. Root50]|nr:peptidase M50 [Sphingomonas sp. Root1294]KQY67393.1 peptidase M50 [Sphingomonas sp. Root50]KRB90770.1 peptidase M50 [Sphingomonas sp. Root720]
MLALLFGLFKLGKVGGTLVTMIVSLAAYSLIFGWRYAAGFVGLLLLHEMGHFIAARQRSLPVSMPTFIPFVGAWIELKGQPMDAETEAYVAAAGPLLGTVGAILVYFWGRETQDGLLLAIAYGGFFLNFFNLIPLSPLDGGRITAIISPRIWFLGVPLMVGLMLYRPSPLLFIIAIAAIPALKQAWTHDPETEENRCYYATSVATRVEYGLIYLSLVAFLAYMTSATHAMIGRV